MMATYFDMSINNTFWSKKLKAKLSGSKPTINFDIRDPSMGVFFDEIA